MNRGARLAFILWLVAGLAVPARAADNRVRFRVTLGDNVAAHPLSGRLLIFMTPNTSPMLFVAPQLPDINAVYICAKEVSTFLPGQQIEVDPDVTAFPTPFSRAPSGNYQVMALLDTNHSYAYSGVGPGSIVSPILPLAHFQPDTAGPVEMTLTARVPDVPLLETPALRVAVWRSELLSAFMGRTVEMRAGVFLPPSYAQSGARRYPTVFYVHGFGSSYADAWKPGALDSCGPAPQEMTVLMRSNNWPEMIYVYLDATCPFGHHEFADSVNNGPWGRALVEEFIPYLEQAFRMEGTASNRFLTGHSSGGWSALWLQITHPDFFGGAWATAPDTVDFRNWLGVNLTRAPAENFYHKSDGTPRWLMRVSNKDVIKTEEFAKWEAVLGEYGGQMASFEAVFSPRGDDGRPMKLFNRDTGAIDPFVEGAWEPFDISSVLRQRWPELGPKLKGKLHVIVGTKDTIHLNEPTLLLEDELKQLRSDASITFLEGRDHFNLYEGGLARKMAMEMYATAHSQPKPGGTPGK